MLKPGDLAPDFALPDADGKLKKLSELSERFKVVYFYPKDDTSGCTKEAIDFSTLKPEFARLGAAILGISPDSAASHAKFRHKHGLKVALLSDEQKSTIMAYGVWAEKKMYGRTYMGVERSTFLIGPDGKVLKVWRNVKVPGHVAAVLEEVKRHS
ncbi:MAG TPA: peroxiredoxin [Hyphomicrobiales bacterium]|nr:peroxiredoxin [Hyphomicrobiales bacterium]